jgi:hypothetical protein
MSSTINTTSIDTAFPVAGQDNDSQGLRDNFTNINTNFIAAKDEIQDLQSKVVLKSALTGGVVDNDFSGTLIKSAQYQDLRATVSNVGSVAGVTNINVAAAPYYKITTSAAIVLQFTNFTAAGTRSEVAVEVDVTDVAHTIELPAEVIIGKAGIQTVAGNTITVSSTGKHIYQFSSSDNGATIVVNDLTESRITPRLSLAAAPAASIGAVGDLAGMIAFDSSYVYLCIADYDGGTSIWTRATAATW